MTGSGESAGWGPGIGAGAAAELLGRWWFAYDEGEFDHLGPLLTDDVHFTCRTDTGQSAYEDFVRADLRGRQAVIDWQTRHRVASPYPLRHHSTSVHLLPGTAADVPFRGYLCVIWIVDGSATILSSGVVTGTVRAEADGLRISALHVVLDTRSSIPFGERG